MDSTPETTITQKSFFSVKDMLRHVIFMFFWASTGMTWAFVYVALKPPTVVSVMPFSKKPATMYWVKSPTVRSNDWVQKRKQFLLQEGSQIMLDDNDLNNWVQDSIKPKKMPKRVEMIGIATDWDAFKKTNMTWMDVLRSNVYANITQSPFLRTHVDSLTITQPASIMFFALKIPLFVQAKMTLHPAKESYNWSLDEVWIGGYCVSSMVYSVLKDWMWKTLVGYNNEMKRLNDLWPHIEYIRIKNNLLIMKRKGNLDPID